MAWQPLESTPLQSRPRQERQPLPLPTPTKENEQPRKYGRREEDIHVEPSETSGDTLINAPPSFDMGRNLDLLDSGPRTDALDFHNQSMHSQGNQSFGSHRLDLTWVSAYNPVTTRSRRSSTYGTPVSPPAPKQDKENPQYSDKEILNFATLIYVKPGTEEDANGVPGTMPPIYTPRPIAVGPHLPYHGRPGWPLSLDVADEMMTLLAIRGSQWSKTRPLTVEPPPGALSIKKKAKSAKAIKVESRFVRFQVRRLPRRRRRRRRREAHLASRSAERIQPYPNCRGSAHAL
ncbi:hypothetical protein VTO58DRAFT_103232 [Aureobasidium pullulans]